MAAPDPDRRQALTILVAGVIGAVILAAVLYWGATTLLPDFQAWADGVFSQGLGLRTSAIIAAAVAFSALVVLAIASGDGLLGEIQFVIPGFFLFFLFFWLMTAWVF
jgi:hypothetical protein